jgi:LEA14-like dessication related protein
MADGGWRGPRPALTIATWALVILALSGCASLRSRLAAPRVIPESIAIGGIRGADAIVTLGLRLENPNDTDLTLQSLRFSLSINDIALTTGTTVSVETIAARGSTVIQLETRTNIAAALQVIALTAGARVPSLQYSVDGEAIVQNGIRLPFTRRGEIPIPSSMPSPKPMSRT